LRTAELRGLDGAVEEYGLSSHWPARRVADVGRAFAGQFRILGRAALSVALNAVICLGSWPVSSEREEALEALDQGHAGEFVLWVLDRPTGRHLPGTRPGGLSGRYFP
jgi:hypothetical protein